MIGHVPELRISGAAYSCDVIYVSRQYSQTAMYAEGVNTISVILQILCSVLAPFRIVATITGRWAIGIIELSLLLGVLRAPVPPSAFLRPCAGHRAECSRHVPL
jgi:hypothetical protein